MPDWARPATRVLTSSTKAAEPTGAWIVRVAPPRVPSGRVSAEACSAAAACAASVLPSVLACGVGAAESASESISVEFAAVRPEMSFCTSAKELILPAGETAAAVIAASLVCPAWICKVGSAPDWVPAAASGDCPAIVAFCAPPTVEPKPGGRPVAGAAIPAATAPMVVPAGAAAWPVAGAVAIARAAAAGGISACANQTTASAGAGVGVAAESVLPVAALAGTAPAVVLGALRPNALAMRLLKSLLDSWAASCGSVLSWLEVAVAAMVGVRVARALPRVWAEGPMVFGLEAALLSGVPGCLVALLVWVPGPASAFGASPPVAAGAPVVCAEKLVLAGVEAPSVNVLVSIPT